MVTTILKCEEVKKKEKKVKLYKTTWFKQKKVNKAMRTVYFVLIDNRNSVDRKIKIKYNNFRN